MNVRNLATILDEALDLANDPKACEDYSARMFEDSITASYFGNNLMGCGDQSQTPVQLLTEQGEQIPYDLDAQLQGQGAYGDDKLEEHESLDEHRDKICIGEVRCVYKDGRMTSLQQVQNLREKARKSLVDGNGRLCDQLSMLALSGRSGAVNADVLDDDVLRVCKNNRVFTEPDSDHIFYGYGNDDKSVATLDESDTLTLAKIKELRTYAAVMGNDGGGEGVVSLRPLRVNGGEYYVLLLHPDSVADLREDLRKNFRKSTNKDPWQSIEEEARKAAEAVGSKSPIFKKALGMIDNILLHEHPSVPLFNDGGSTGNVPWSRAFLLGRQALIWGFGGAQPGQFDWREGTSDLGNQTWIAAYTRLGVKRATFKGKALSMIAVDHALSKKPAGV